MRSALAGHEYAIIRALNQNLSEGSIVMEERLSELLSNKTLQVWNDLVSEVDSLYEVDKLWNKGFGDWEIEYKYCRGGKNTESNHHRELDNLFSVVRNDTTSVGEIRERRYACIL